MTLDIYTRKFSEICIPPGFGDDLVNLARHRQPSIGNATSLQPHVNMFIDSGLCPYNMQTENESLQYSANHVHKKMRCSSSRDRERYRPNTVGLRFSGTSSISPRLSKSVAYGVSEIELMPIINEGRVILPLTCSLWPCGRAR